jgi:hypothetical protein
MNIMTLEVTYRVLLFHFPPSLYQYEHYGHSNLRDCGDCTNGNEAQKWTSFYAHRTKNAPKVETHQDALQHCYGCARKSDGFWNLKASLPATRRFHTDNHRAQCCLVFSWHGNIIFCVNKCFHFAIKLYFISKTVRFSGALCITTLFPLAPLLY